MSGQPDAGDTLHAIGALARSTAHDLNNCMAAVMTFAEIVLESLPAQHPLRGEVHGILSAGRRVILRTRELDLMVEDDMATIIARVDAVLASLPAAHPLREDLLEIRTAAQLAVEKTEQLLASASLVPLRRAS